MRVFFTTSSPGSNKNESERIDVRMRDREQAALAAEATVTNIPGYCQLQTRLWFDAPSAGDFDDDGAADAEDGWKIEPAKYKHPGDRNPPRGTPVSFLGGRNDNGHRAISLGGSYRSTDFNTATQSYQAGVVGTAHSIEALERAMGVTYAGWSETMDGVLIPLPPAEQTRGPRVDNAIDSLKEARDVAKNGSKRESILKKAIRTLRGLTTWDKKRK